MGASGSNLARCALCSTQTERPVVLKCNHQFCRGCIGDLWSCAPDGPYLCPEWRCKTVYRNLPFDRSLIRLTTNNQRAQTHTTTGTSSNNEQTKFDSELRRPSLTSRLLGKRKAGIQVTEQPDVKRSTVEAAHEQTSDAEPPSTSSSHPITDAPGQPTGAEASKTLGQLESTQAERNDKTSCDSLKGKAGPASDVPPEASPQQNRTEDIISLDDSDSFDEVDICDAPQLATPKRETQVTGLNASPSSPATFPGASPAGKTSPSLSVGKSPTPTKLPAAPSSFRAKGKHDGPLLCHYCPKAGCKSAVKTCLVCGASMCSEHLRPHLDSPVFQNHTLVPPVEDISTWRCQDHQEINRIYCRECEVCVCTVCTVIGSHRDHICISIREAEREFRGKLKEEIKLLQEAEERVKTRVTELTQKKETFRVVLSQAQAGVQQQYGTIREALEQEEQTALQCVKKEERKVLGGLEEKLGHFQRALQSVQQGLHSLEGLADAKGDQRIQDQAFIMEYSRAAQLTGSMGSSVDQIDDSEEVDQARLQCLRRWTEKRLETFIIPLPGKDRDLYRLLYGSIPSLNPDTAHPKLLLSDNNRTVAYSEAPQAYTEHEARFSSFPQVLASRALEAGRWYWEVSVSVDEGRWKVGLCEEQIERKGQRDGSRLGFNSHSWCLACDRRKVEVLHNKVGDSVEAVGLQRVGVFLDFEEGSLAFFKVTPGGSLALMHSYQHRFPNPVYPAFSVSKTCLTICDLFQS